jgi:uncharacterized SAM-binding protein YcdF (DUF218 family)
VPGSGSGCEGEALPVFVTLKTLLRTLILPPASLLALCFVGLWLVARHPAGRARRTGLALLSGALVALWLLATPVIADLLQRTADRVPALSPESVDAAQAQAIVILAGGAARHRAPEYGHAPAAGDELLERLAYGAYLAHRTALPILVSGDFGESESMHTVLARDFGVATRWVESHSRDTFQNALNSAPLLRAAGVRRILLVTSAAHVFRAAHEFEAAGFEVVAAPVGVWEPQDPNPTRYLPSVVGLRRSTEALYELIGEPARRVFQLLHLRRHEAAGAE